MRCYSSYIKEGEKRREKDDERDNVICFIKKKKTSMFMCILEYVMNICI